jgi:hypothetical protein
MWNLGNRKLAKPPAALVALVVALSMVLVTGGAGTAAGSTETAATTTRTVVAHNPQGKVVSKIVGTTANGRSVTGYFTPLHFSKRDGKVRVRGLINGVVHNADGTSRTFAVLRTMRVKSINGTPATTAKGTAQAMATCDILHLVLAPLDLDLLGLQVHLDKVVLDIVAKSGAGNLLGNLLCAVTGLLDGGLSGALGRLVDLLNQILGRLGLGL